jgi:RNA polymerase-interacting CarD/CdnL/TRCF family regulator
METATVEPGNDPMHEQNQRKDPQRERRLLAARPQAFAQEVWIERSK